MVGDDTRPEAIAPLPVPWFISQQAPLNMTAAPDASGATAPEFCLQQFATDFAATRQLSAAAVAAATRLLQEGNTLPFIARYRKEATGGLTETQLRQIEDAIQKTELLLQRKATILKSLQEQQVLDAALRTRIMQCESAAALEELYLPYRPRRRTRATTAREAGLEPLAELILTAVPGQQSRDEVLQSYIDPARGIPDAASALRGACDILAETWADHPECRRLVHDQMCKGDVCSTVRRGKRESGEHFRDYFEFRQRYSSVPSHRFLAILRGENEGVLRVQISTDEDHLLRRLQQHLLGHDRRLFYHQLADTVADCLNRLLRPAIEKQLLRELRERSDLDAVEVFAGNLRSLLLAPPAGRQVTLGIDPGYRTGCKLAVVDGTGMFLDHSTIFPTPPRSEAEQSAAELLRLIRRHAVTLIAIGNGTASRETHSFVRDLIRSHNLAVTAVLVSESGASVYSAGELAVQEYPHLDVTVRGAISIAHRLQDPLAELVKIDPRSIGVGQYQHDVDQQLLKKTLDREVESCVNAVGVDLNTASPALLSFVAGIGGTLASRIVAWRDQHGAFRRRDDLLSVPRLGPAAFQQAAGFLRINDGSEPLDRSAVHPEQYSLVRRMAASCDVAPAQLLGNAAVLERLQPAQFVTAECGELTVRDVLQELARPGRDPRQEFREVRFDDTVTEMSQLRPEMKLQGVVTNVTQFGAFVDIGVHQDGLIHISQMADRFVSSPADIVSTGDIVHVRVLDIDLQRKRIALSLKSPENGND